MENEWVNKFDWNGDRVTEWINELMNEWMGDVIWWKRGTNDWIWIPVWPTDSMNKWMNEWPNDRMTVETRPWNRQKGLEKRLCLSSERAFRGKENRSLLTNSLDIPGWQQLHCSNSFCISVTSKINKTNCSERLELELSVQPMIKIIRACVSKQIILVHQNFFFF